MENASKALIIAGAILISILLISVGIMIFNSSNGLFSSATRSMSDQEKQMFNQKFTIYEGTKISGSSVKELQRLVTANNADEENVEVTLDMATADATIKNAKQYTVTMEDTDTDGLIDSITVDDPA